MLYELLPSSIYIILIIFARLGGAMMLLPGFGESYVSPRVRLGLSILICIVIAPALVSKIPPMSESVADLGLLIFGEIVIGIFMGTIARLFLSATASAGMIAANLSSLANALIQDPTAEQQASIMGTFMSSVALVLIFVLDIHHLFLHALVDSYELFVPGQSLPTGDFSNMISRVVADTFTLAARMAAPFIVVGVIFFLGLGLLAKLMPQMQVFFIAMPLQVLMGIVVLFLSLPVMIRVFLTSLNEHWIVFVR
ncbi:flagellar biosynthetic protein FliR [Kiloniella laminariae]|uniref:Flagellar biosynthetic protein FliR n=1 Tax=Kiloniella laminariae TaxID=454162 RepID=A0ABT4LH93_9PROT|nr:flagellar biosynthetic protein FliR [Kiloniella laminariae]MCZ4280473.1 flagellar biosynthetic protein FliR [Kiloniella laminariae]